MMDDTKKKVFHTNMKVFRAALCLAVSLASATSAFAAGEGESNLFAGDLGNVIWTLVIFLGLLFVLGKFAWGPILDGLKQREDYIRKSLEEAKNNREEAEARLREFEERLKEARAEATAIVDEGRRDAEVLRGRIEEEAREEAEKIRERTLRDIHIAKETAMKELYEVSGKLSTQIASQIIGRELKAADHHKLIEDAIAEMEGLKTH